MIRSLILLAFVLSAAPLRAQDRASAMPADGHDGHAMTMNPAEEPGAGKPATEEPVGTDLEPGSATAPSAPTDRYADRYWPAAAMAAARDKVRHEHGGMAASMVAINIAEWQPEQGRDRFRWDGEGWFGGDINRFTVKSEGEGAIGKRAEEAEVQALYSRALDAYWNLQAGVRQDLQPGRRRTYATLGVEGLAPYWFEVEGALFLSNRGEVLGRVEAYYDQRLTQRLILQPRTEIEFAAQDVRANRIGRGISEVSFDLRLRYEMSREFAPYVGVSWERKLGRTADLARADGEDRGSARLAVGVRAWF